MLGKGSRLNADDVAIDARAMLVPGENGTFHLGAELDIALPSIADPEQAASLVHQAHQLCPYSRATRDNIDVALIVNGAPLSAHAQRAVASR
jgi:organic hydroperoxide reductase OsmC/OhrA